MHRQSDTLADDARNCRDGHRPWTAVVVTRNVRDFQPFKRADAQSFKPQKRPMIMRLIDYFDRGADLFPQRDCLHDGTRGWTYADVRGTTHRVANGLLAAGLKRGDKVAVYSPNHAMAYAACSASSAPG